MEGQHGYDNDNNVQVVTSSPPNDSGGGQQQSHKTSWNPDAIDVTLNPNKGRKSTTEKELREIREREMREKNGSTQLFKHEIPATDVKDQVLQSDDYKKARGPCSACICVP